MRDRNQGTRQGAKRGIIKTIHLWLDRTRLGEILLTKGLITSGELRQVLKTQKETQAQIGQILLDEKIITHKDLFGVLVRQRLTRVIATFVLFLASVSHVKESQADTLTDVPAQVSIVSNFNAQNVSYNRLNYRPGLFGSEEKKSRNLKPFTKWTTMFQRFEQDSQTQKGSLALKRWKNELRTLQGLPLLNMAKRVNQMVNETRYIIDNKNWGKSDYWATPVEFLQRGGDCEDFAIAKYTALRMLGVPEERLRVAIVHDTIKNIPHAVLAVYTDEGLYILDNQIKTMVSAESAGRYRPIFSINRTAWWLHTAPGVTRVASAQ